MTILGRALAVFTALFALFSVAFAILIAVGYVRHTPSGDQAGAGLGMLFYLGFVVPSAALSLALTVLSVRRTALLANGASVSALDVLLRLVIQGAALLTLLIAVAIASIKAWLFAAVTLVYALTLWTGGSLLRPTTEGRRRAPLVYAWISGALLAGLLLVPATILTPRHDPNAPAVNWQSVFTFYSPTLAMIVLTGVALLLIARPTRSSRPPTGSAD